MADTGFVNRDDLAEFSNLAESTGVPNAFKELSKCRAKRTSSVKFEIQRSGASVTFFLNFLVIPGEYPQVNVSDI